MLKTMIASAAEFVSAPALVRRLLRGVRAIRREAVALLATNAIIGPLVAMLPLSVLLSALGVGPRGSYEELDQVSVLSHQGSSFPLGCVVFAVIGVLAVAADGGRARRVLPASESSPAVRLRAAGLVAWGVLVWAVGFVAAVLSAIAPIGPGGVLSPDLVWLLLLTAVGVGAGWAAFAVIAFCIGVIVNVRALGIAVSLILLVVLPVAADAVLWPIDAGAFLPMSAARAVAAPGIAEQTACGALVLGFWVSAAVALALRSGRRRTGSSRSSG